jgi:hypothetical protein
MWLGKGFSGGNAYFQIPESEVRNYAEGVYDKTTGLVKFRNVVWYTNLDHGKRHQPLNLMTMEDNKKFNKKVQNSETAYKKYDNYDAIEVPFTDAIPSDYDGIMGVPISFLDKYCPEQFEILGSDYNVKEGLLPQLINPNWNGKLDRGYVDNQRLYTRLLIKHRKNI